MTYLELTNAVLKKLRESTVSSVQTSTYSKLIGSLINEAKREVEDAWNWVQLRSTIQITTVASTFRYTLTGAGDRFRIQQVLNDTQDVEMRKVSHNVMNRWFLLGDSQTGSPIYYNINGQSSGDPNVDIYPIPNAVEVINFNMVLPQDDFGTSDDATEMTVPDWPVILLAYAKAIEERGEDAGVNSSSAYFTAHQALADAIAIDSRNTCDELTWYVD